MRQTLLKPIVVASLCLSVVGCNAVTGEAKRTIEYIFRDIPDYELTAQEIDEFPYTALYINQEESPQSLVVLGYADSYVDENADGAAVVQNFSWVSQERETIVTRQGRIIRTEGLHANLTGLSDLQADPLHCVVTSPANCDLNWTRHHDFTLRDGTRISRRVSSEFEIGGEQALSLPAGETNVTLVREHVDVELEGHRYVNEFWIEADGHVVKSKQWTLYNEPRFTLTQVKWVGR